MMKNISLKSLSAIIIRLFAVFIVIYTLRNLLSISFYYVDGTYGSAVWGYWVFSILSLITAAILWKFPNLITEKIISWEIEETEEQKQSAEQLEIVGFSLIGLFYLFYAITDFAHWCLLIWLDQKANDIAQPFSIDQKASLIITILEVLLALIIILRSRGLVGLLRKIRNAGL